jgi:hypothetical protein
MNKQHILVIVAAAVISSGCATVTRGTNDTLVVNSNPPGANVRISNGQTSKTPATFKLKRNQPVHVTISKLGYQPQSVQVMPQIEGAGAAGMAGNVLVGGIIGVGVDAVSGAMYDLTPNPLFVTLEKDNDE